MPTPRPAWLSWLARLIAAVIMGQTLFFKFSGAPEPVAIFTTLGAEPWGRLGTASAEALAVVLLLLPRTAAWGALLTLGLMAGALGSHLTVLGIEVEGDGGLLFGMAVVTFICALVVLVIHRRQVPLIGSLTSPGS